MAFAGIVYNLSQVFGETTENVASAFSCLSSNVIVANALLSPGSILIRCLGFDSKASFLEDILGPLDLSVISSVGSAIVFYLFYAFAKKVLNHYNVAVTGWIPRRL